jgi:hypothetical protein
MKLIMWLALLELTFGEWLTYCNMTSGRLCLCNVFLYHLYQLAVPYIQLILIHDP